MRFFTPYRFALCLPLLLAASSCNPAKDTPPPSPAPAVEQPEPEPLTWLTPEAFDQGQAFSEVSDFVALGPRVSGTEASKTAANYLVEKLKGLGIKVELDKFVHTTPRGVVTFRNVVGTVRGTGRDIIILASHYDTKANIDEAFVGANDSGSSTGILLELARLAAQGPTPPVDIVFAFFDGEEAYESYGPDDGLHGSRHMAQSYVEAGLRDLVRGLILLDMVGDKNLTVTIPRNGSPKLVKAVFDAARAEGVRDKFELYPFEIGDDHEPFLRAGIPAVDIIDFYYGQRRKKNNFWHTAEDTMDKISADSLGIVGRVTIRAINTLLAEPVGN